MSMWKGRENGDFAGFYGETCELEPKRKVCYDWLVKKRKNRINGAKILRERGL